MDSAKGEAEVRLSDLERDADGQYVFMLDDLEAGEPAGRGHVPACAASDLGARDARVADAGGGACRRARSPSSRSARGR